MCKIVTILVSTGSDTDSDTDTPGTPQWKKAKHVNSKYHAEWSRKYHMTHSDKRLRGV